MKVRIRLEGPDDAGAIRDVNVRAFDRPAEARLVELLRARGRLLVSMVAESEGVLVGHIAFSRVVIEAHPELAGAGLGPMAVLPARQRQGIGSMLVRAGLEHCRQSQYDFAVVLGHAAYYPRFGFVPASRFGLHCAWPVPEGVFMAAELRAGALAGTSGLVSYGVEFNDV